MILRGEIGPCPREGMGCYGKGKRGGEVKVSDARMEREGRGGS